MRSRPSLRILTLTGCALLGLVPAAALAQRTVPVEEQFRGYVSHQFVGVTTVTTGANAGGYGGMDALCRAEIPDSRLCSSREILDSAAAISPGGTSAWVRGEYEIIPNSTSATNPFIWIDRPSGNAETATVSEVTNLGCQEYISSSASFRTIVWGGSGNQIFYRTSCNGTRPVACCAPRFVPAGP